MSGLRGYRLRRHSARRRRGRVVAGARLSKVRSCAGRRAGVGVWNRSGPHAHVPLRNRPLPHMPVCPCACFVPLTWSCSAGCSSRAPEFGGVVLVERGHGFGGGVHAVECRHHGWRLWSRSPGGFRPGYWPSGTDRRCRWWTLAPRLTPQSLVADPGSPHRDGSPCYDCAEPGPAMRGPRGRRGNAGP